MTLNEIYHQIGQRAVSAIPEKWISAEVLIKRLNDYTRAGGTYMNETGAVKMMDNAKFAHPFSDIIQELHAITTDNETNKNKWNKLKFTLLPTGKFNLEFIFDEAWEKSIHGLNGR